MPLATLFQNLIYNLQHGNPTFWTVWGLTANVLFGGSFLLQWWSSERARKSIVPASFWWVRTGGAFMMFIYTLHVGKLPLIIGAFFSLPVCIRNLMLIHKEQARLSAGSSCAAEKEGPIPDAKKDGFVGPRAAKAKVAKAAEVTR